MDVVLHATHVYLSWTEPITDGLAALATGYRVVISIGGAWLTARLAPRNPMTHALILGGVGVVLGVVGLLTTWNKGLGPHWYPIALVVLTLPQCWVGGKIHEMRSRGAPA